MQENLETNVITNDIKNDLTKIPCENIGNKNEKNKYYVYHLIDPRKNIPFYVGKGSEYRHTRHVGLVKKGKIPNNNIYLFRKINKILNCGLNISHSIIKKNITEKEAYDLEINEIKRLKNERIELCNLTDGGDGVTMTPEIRRKISISEKGKTVSEESKRKMSLSKLGKKRSQQVRENMRKIMTGHIVSDKSKEKMRSVKLGKYKKEENGKYIRYSTETLNEIKKLYLLHNKISIITNIFNNKGIKISRDIITKRLNDMGLCTRKYKIR